MTQAQPDLIAGLTDDEFFGLTQSFKAPRRRLIVLMDLYEPKQGEIFLLPTVVRKRLVDKNLLFGTVISSGVDNFEIGDRVGVLPWEGLHVGHYDPSIPCSQKIPVGRQLRFYKAREDIDRVVMLHG